MAMEVGGVMRIGTAMSEKMMFEQGSAGHLGTAGLPV